jgi:hypothetical protein
VSLPTGHTRGNSETKHNEDFVMLWQYHTYHTEVKHWLTDTERHVSIIQTSEMKVLRKVKVCDGGDKERNEDIRTEFDVTD